MPPEITNIDLINLVAAIASLVLAVIAIWQAIHFYNQAKSTELNTALTLESIKTQSTMLERLTAKWMDRFTKYVTNPRPIDETTTKLLEFIEIRQMALNLPSPEDSKQKSELIQELITSYIAVLYYVGISNITTQQHLPEAIEDLDQNEGIKQIVDQSKADYVYLKGVLANIDQTQLESSRLKHLYDQALGWNQFIKDTASVYSSRASNTNQGSGT